VKNGHFYLYLNKFFSRIIEKEKATKNMKNYKGVSPELID